MTGCRSNAAAIISVQEPRRSHSRPALPAKKEAQVLRRPWLRALGAGPSAKEEAQVLRRQAAQRLGVFADGALEDELLLLLQLQDALLDGAADHKAHHVDRLVLPQPVDAVLRLRLRRVPAEGFRA